MLHIIIIIIIIIITIIIIIIIIIITRSLKRIMPKSNRDSIPVSSSCNAWLKTFTRKTAYSIDSCHYICITSSVITSYSRHLRTVVIRGGTSHLNTTNSSLVFRNRLRASISMSLSSVRKRARANLVSCVRA